jgi:hypothetical protein
MSIERTIVRVMPDSEIEPGSKQLCVRSAPAHLASQGDVDVGHSRAFASRQDTRLDFGEQRQALGGDPRYVVAVTMSHC